MTWQENLFSNLLTIGILGGLFLMIYLKYTDKTLVEFIQEMREVIYGPVEEVYDMAQGGFENIV